MGFLGDRRKCGCGVWFIAVKEPYLCAQCAVQLEKELHLGTPLTLSHNDKRFLKSLKIDPDK